MGQVKQAIIEVEDFVAGCLRQGRTLNQLYEMPENLWQQKLILILMMRS